MFCPNCGKEIDEKSKFCEYCGMKISDTEDNIEKDIRNDIPEESGQKADIGPEKKSVKKKTPPAEKNTGDKKSPKPKSKASAQKTKKPKSPKKSKKSDEEKPPNIILRIIFVLCAVILFYMNVGSKLDTLLDASAGVLEIAHHLFDGCSGW